MAYTPPPERMKDRSPTPLPDDFSPHPSRRLRPDTYLPSLPPSPCFRGETIDYVVHPSPAPASRSLAEIVQWLLQQQTPQLLAATESLRDRWRTDAATLERLMEITQMNLSGCEMIRFGDQYTERWASANLSILLDCMPQLTSLDLQNSHPLRNVREKFATRASWRLSAS